MAVWIVDVDGNAATLLNFEQYQMLPDHTSRKVGTIGPRPLAALFLRKSATKHEMEQVGWIQGNYRRACHVGLRRSGSV